MNTRHVWWVGLFAFVFVVFQGARNSRHLLASQPGQHGPPNAPPATGQPSEPVMLHSPPPRPPADFGGPPQDIAPRRNRFDAAETQKEAEELAILANKIPGEVRQVSKSVMPKDLSLQLKQIERLAKRLRGQISP